MKKVTIEVVEAFDGERGFENEEACLAYEAANFHKRFVGLTEEQAINALNRDDPELAQHFETAGNRIGALRRKQGEMRRAPRASNGDQPAPDTAGHLADGD